MRCLRRNWTAALLVVALIVATVAAADDDIRLSGCLVRGENGHGYLVTNVLGEAAWQRSADATVVPGPVGTSGTVSSILYWLEERNGLDAYAGHYIEVDGKFQGDLKEGHVEITMKDEWADIEIESDGQSMKAQVPRSSALVAAETGERRLDVLVRRVVPQRIRMLAAGCGR